MAVIQKTPEAEQTAPSTVRTLSSDTKLSPTRSTEARVVTATTPSPAVRSTTPLPNSGTSDKLRLTYTVLLGAAACLALVGVITQNRTSDAGAPDAPPPAVLEQGS